MLNDDSTTDALIVSQQAVAQLRQKKPIYNSKYGDTVTSEMEHQLRAYAADERKKAENTRRRVHAFGGADSESDAAYADLSMSGSDSDDNIDQNQDESSFKPVQNITQIPLSIFAAASGMHTIG